MAKNKKSPLISSEELNQNLAPYAKRFMECHKLDGLGILEKGAIAAEVHREADEVNMLSELDTWFPEMADMKKSKAMNCLALHLFWTIDRPGIAEKLPARYFTKDGISKLIHACRLERAREKAEKNGKFKDLGRFRGLDISDAGIKYNLADPPAQVDILENNVIALKIMMKRPKPVSRKKPNVTDSPSCSGIQNVMSASKATLQGMVTQLLSDLDIANAEKEQLRRALLALCQDIDSPYPAVLGLQMPHIEKSKTTTLVPDSIAAPLTKVIEFAEDTVDEADVDGTADATVDVLQTALSNGSGITTDDVADGRNLSIDDQLVALFDEVASPGNLDESYFDILDIPMGNGAQQAEPDRYHAKLEVARPARNIGSSNGASNNTPYAGGAF